MLNMFSAQPAGKNAYRLALGGVFLALGSEALASTYRAGARLACCLCLVFGSRPINPPPSLRVFSRFIENPTLKN